jgi:AraC-like DNA-binding protein
VRQKRSESAELATIYDTQGKERQIAEQSAKNRLVTAISMALGAVVMLVMAFALYILLQWRITQRRNRILAHQITVAVEYKEKYRALKQAQQAESQAKQTPAPAAPRAEEPAKPAEPAEPKAEATEPSKATEPAVAEPSNVGAGLSISDGTAITDEQMFLFLRDLIENEQLFLQPDFGRQTLIERTGLSKETIGAAFAQGSASTSLPAYVRELRLDYAVRLMNDKPELTVEQVSMASGFTSADTFTRNFRAKFGMTPTTYKQTQNDA